MDFILDNGMYNYTAFESVATKDKPAVVWKIISTKCQVNYGALKSIDSFVSPKGQIVDWKREDVLKAFKDGKIKAHELSVIPPMNTSKKK